MHHFDSGQREVLAQCKAAALHAEKILTDALECHSKGEWVELPADRAVLARQELDWALKRHADLFGVAISESEAIANQAWNAMEYSAATIDITLEGVRAYRGRAISASHQLRSLAGAIDTACRQPDATTSE